MHIRVQEIDNRSGVAVYDKRAFAPPCRAVEADEPIKILRRKESQHQRRGLAEQARQRILEFTFCHPCRSLGADMSSFHNQRVDRVVSYVTNETSRHTWF